MPQPLSSVLPSGDFGQVSFGSTQIMDRPKLAAAVMNIIGIWASIEANLLRALTTFLKADFVVVTEMMHALASSEGRMAAVQAAARTSLSSEDFRLFSAVIKASKASRNRRNEFAHHIWGTTDKLPDVLLLVDPKHINRDMAASREDLSAFHRWHVLPESVRGPAPPLSTIKMPDPRYIFVFGSKELAFETNEALRASVFILEFIHVIEKTPIGDTRSTLVARPQIRQALQQMSNENAP